MSYIFFLSYFITFVSIHKVFKSSDFFLSLTSKFVIMLALECISIAKSFIGWYSNMNCVDFSFNLQLYSTILGF